MLLRQALQSIVLVIVVFTVAICPATGQQGGPGMVVSDNELAAKTGMDVLNRGGNAIDAAVATAFALAVLDPAASGLGGGGFMVIYQSKDRRAHALDFRETAPEAARSDLYVKADKSVPSLSLIGGLAVGVPGQVAGLVQALRRFGSMPLPLLVAPAIRYASEGFAVDAALRYAIERQISQMKQFPDLGRVFLPRNEIPAAGESLRQPELAETLRSIAQNGADAFYHGWIAQAIVEAVKKEGGVLALEDLKNYRPVWREPLIGTYRNRTLVAMPPPSSGGVALIQMLNVLEGYQLADLAHNSATYLHLLAEVMKHAFADRAQYLGDPDFVKVPIPGLTSKEYAAWIRRRISPAKTYPAKYYGYGNYRAEQGGTTHFSVIDAFGNAVACTLSINTRFGSKVLVPKAGIVLNNTIDDFAIHGAGNIYGLVGGDANSLRPRKRPLSSMAPTIILHNDRPEVIVGAAGGPRIISATLQTILNVLDFRMSAREAVDGPRIHHQWLPEQLSVEAKITGDVRHSLERRGHGLRDGRVGVVQAIVAQDGKTAGAADPRKTERASDE